MIKVALIGAGSVVFSRNLTGDILSYPEFRDATLAYHDIDPDRLDVATALARKGRPWWRTGVNTEAKLMLLRHAFETLGANRVEFKTDSRNERANPALLGIGATFEGGFRDHMIMPDGTLRTSNYYSVIAPEWPAVKARLEASLRGESR